MNTTDSMRVLVLDDDSTTLRLLSHHFSASSMEVVACREIEAAEAILDHSRMDAVLTDLCLSPMGGVDGTRLIRHVSTHFPETQIVAMSSHHGEEIRRLVLGAGASEFLHKPINPAMAVQALRRRNTAERPASSGGSVCEVENLDDFLEANPVFSHLQPIVDLSKGDAPFLIHGVEALARAPRGSIFCNPEILFGYASRKDRLFETDLHCIQAGLREAVHLGGRARVFLNVQPRSMSNPVFAGCVTGMVEAAGLGPEQVVFELTEQETILNPGAFATAINGLRRRGYHVALDDFGVGFANLHLILDLMPEYVKISGYFARGLPTHPAKQVALSAIHGMLRTLRIPAILECVETEVELEIVRRLGIEYAQGYHFARPAPAAELLDSARFEGWRKAAAG